MLHTLSKIEIGESHVSLIITKYWIVSLIVKFLNAFIPVTFIHSKILCFVFTDRISVGVNDLSRIKVRSFFELKVLKKVSRIRINMICESDVER